jgi:lipoprotein-releasing system permease protein
MYKLLLCWRYLRTRYIALASIVSVMLGVATMIVVNSVMEGFSSEMQNRIHGILSDVVIDAQSLDGVPDAAWHEQRIRQVVGDQIEAVSATVVVPAMLNFQCGGRWIPRPVQLIGIDEKTQSSVSDFSRYLQHPENRTAMRFKLREGGYDVRNYEAGPDVPERTQMQTAGWARRHEMARAQKFQQDFYKNEKPKTSPKSQPVADPFAGHPAQESLFDPEKQEHTGAVLGIAMTSYRTSQGEDKFLVVPGDDIKLTTVTVGQPPKDTSDYFTVVDFYESKMSEYDSTFIFVPIRKLQELRGMIDPTTGVGLINSLQIKLKPGADGDAVRDRLRAAFPPEVYSISTWRDKQGPLLAAVRMESAILNVLLFMIIAVAGFGILAIFYMIVVEKTRDIGILKSLGAPGRGVMGIFLSYGLSLGIVGSGVGMLVGLVFVRYINEIAAGLGWLTGRPVFDPKIYYFYKIPTIVVPETIAWIVTGALFIAVMASVLPARRAARLHPVEALRYE